MELMKNILVGILKGFYDSIKGIILVFTLDKEISHQLKLNEQLSSRHEHYVPINVIKKEDAKIMSGVLKCSALNGGIFWLSIIIFEYGIIPLIKYLLFLPFGASSPLSKTVWGWMYPLFSMIIGIIWVLPLFILSRIVNTFWFQDIANSAYKIRKGESQLPQNLSNMVADTIFSVIVQTLFLIQSNIVCLMPYSYLGSAFSFFHICLLYALYSFEYKWFNMGWKLHKRLTYIEQNWPYFFGFGIPLAFLTHLPNSYVVSGCVFSIAFPIFILSGNEADPFNGSSSFPLRLFSPVVCISNLIFKQSVRPTNNYKFRKNEHFLNYGVNVRYGTGVDVWAIGCVCAEMIKGESLWPGRSTFF